MSYAAATALAKRLLGKKGASIVLTRPHGGALNKLTGTRATGSDETAVFNCVALPPGKSAEKEIGTLVNRRLMEFHLARTSGTLEPEPGDVVPWKGRGWTLIWAAVYDPDAEGMVYAKAYGEVSG